MNYCIAGIPCLRNGEDVKWKTYVSGQGWDASSLRATSHVFLALDNNGSDKVYILLWKSSTNNLIYSAEFYNSIKVLIDNSEFKFKDIIKLDGGGSFICRSSDLGIDISTSENRRINCIITFDTRLDKQYVTVNQFKKVIDVVDKSLVCMSNYIDSLREEIKMLSSFAD